MLSTHSHPTETSTKTQEKSSAVALWVIAFLLLLIFLHGHGWAQGIKANGNTRTVLFSGAPSGACAPFAVAIDTTTGNFYDCQSSAWMLVGPIGGSGSGTVTSFNAGNLSPLFISSVANSATTPALTFSLSNAAANTVFGNNTGSPTAPAYFGFIPPITKAAVASNWLTGFDSTAGLFTASQPTYSDISGTPQLAITKTAVVSNWLRSYDSTTGLFAASQPAFTDISGSVAASQMPALTGDITTSAGAVATTLATVATPGTGLKTTINAKGLATAVTTAACADLSNASASCSTDATNAGNLSAGTLLAGRMPAHTGDVTSSAGSVALTIAASAVTRADLAAGAKNWAFCGTANGATVTVGPVSASTCCSGGLCRQFLVYVMITGYSGGTPVGRLLVANGTISTTALTNSFSVSEGVTAPTTGLGATAVPGFPMAVTLSAIGRMATVYIDGASGSIKTMHAEGVEGTPSVATAPVLFRGASFFSDLGSNLALANFQLSVYDTLATTAVSSRTFNSGTYLAVWGRSTD